MINIADKYVIRPDHISGVSSLLTAPGQPAMRLFEVYLSGGQTLTVKLATEAAQTARQMVIQTVNNLP